MNKPVCITLILGTALVACTQASAAQRHDLGLEPVASLDRTSQTVAGLTARIDPLSGQLVEPDIATMQVDHLVNPAPDYSKVQIEKKANGATVVHMNGQYMSRSVARLRPDGSYDESEDAGGAIGEIIPEGSPRK